MKRYIKLWNDKIMIKGFILTIFFIIISSIPIYGLLNPARVYCESMGYIYTTTSTPEGDIGICILPDSSQVEAWKFLLGEEGRNYSYCERKGYELKITDDFEKCSTFLTKTCAVCVLPNGTEIEVTRLMNLNFEEGSCGDGMCVLGENYLTCPQDCPSGLIDGYCDGIADGICDPDCLSQPTPKLDSDCPVCGNNVCEQEETFNTCPQDCPTQICGDGKCDQGETRENCCVDCGCIGGMKCQNGKCVKTEICGDEICSIHENYMKCKEDCPSGSKDNYCDKVEDDICDPDCSRTGDVDCLCNKNNICESNFETSSNCPEDCKSDFTLIYLILGLIALVSIIIFLKNHSKKTKWQEIYEETSN